MKKKTNNSSGFTLVELIVVMCLMGIIMGAILNLMQPTAQLYTTTNTYLSEEEATNTIYDFINSDLMYTTSIYVVRSDIPDVNAVVAAEGIQPSLYSNCLLLDNVSVRTQGTQAAQNKGATGSITKYGYNGASYVDVSTNPSMLSGQGLYVNSFPLADQSVMEDDKYVFAIAHEEGYRSQSLTLIMNVYLPRYTGTGYEYTERAFNAQKGIELINISAGRIDGTPYYDTDPVDTTLENMDTPASYIYIFYNRKNKVVSTARQIPYECYVKNSDGDYWMCFSSRAPEYGNVESTVASEAETQNVNTYLDWTNRYVYEHTGLYSETENDVYVDGQAYFDLRNFYTPASSVKLYAVYKKTRFSDMPGVTVNFYSDINGTGSPLYTYPIGFGDSITSVPSAGATTESGGVQTRWKWAELGGTIEHTNFNDIVTDINVYRCSYKAYKITFVDSEDNVITDSWTDVTGVTYDASDYYVVEGTTINSSNLPPIDNYKRLDGDGNVIAGSYVWVVDSPAGGTLSQEVNSTVTIKLQYTEPSADPDPSDPDPSDPDPEDPEEPEPGPGPGGDSGAVTIVNSNEQVLDWGFKMLQNTIDITNVSGGDLTGTITIVIDYDVNITGINTIASYANCVDNITSSYSDDKLTIVIKLKNTGNSWETFTNGSSFQVNVVQVKIPGDTARVENMTVSVS